MLPPPINMSDTHPGSSDKSPRSSVGPVARKRKRRPILSCTECRRLKLKCDRQQKVPCSNCVRRNCSSSCPGSNRFTAAPDHPRMEHLESYVRRRETSVSVEPTDSLSVHPRTEAVDIGIRSNANRSSGSLAIEVSRNLDGQDPTNVMGEKTGPTGSHQAQSRPFAPFGTTRELFGSGDRPGSLRSEEEGQSQQLRSDFNLPTTYSGNDIASGGDTGHIQGDAVIQDDGRSFGTLLISRGGRSKYLGPTAASEWLQDQEEQDHNVTPQVSRMPSPETQSPNLFESPHRDREALFPFQVAYRRAPTVSILEALPPPRECSVLVESYFRYFAWHYNIVSRPSLQLIIDTAYASRNKNGLRDQRIHYQDLALLFVVLAMGVLHNLELPPEDSLAEEYIALAKTCLAKGDFLDRTSLSGIRTLHIMAHCHLETEKGRNGDAAWPLWGLAMRLILAMGLHKDGARWGLAPEVVQERRRVFWESNAADVLQANCFSRPCSIHPDYIDTTMPEEIDEDGRLCRGKGFATLKFELSVIAGSVLDMQMKPKVHSYSIVTELHDRLCAFQRGIPYELRCRTALLALPSMYIDPGAAIADSPEINKRDLHLTLQQFTLAFTITESFLFLHRPYFAKALSEQLQDPTKSQYGPSFLSVVERCYVIINLATALHELHPAVCARYWFIWHHSFNCAVCMGTLILCNPRNALASFALSQIEAAIKLFTNTLQINKSARIIRNLKWLTDIHARAQNRLQNVSSHPSNSQAIEQQYTEENERDLELIGWHTRLVQRANVPRRSQGASHGQPQPEAANQEPSPTTALNESIVGAVQQHFLRGLMSTDSTAIDLFSGPVHGDTTDEILHQYWDPMALQNPITFFEGEAVGDSNWWDLANPEL